MIKKKGWGKPGNWGVVFCVRRERCLRGEKFPCRKVLLKNNTELNNNERQGKKLEALKRKKK